MIFYDKMGFMEGGKNEKNYPDFFDSVGGSCCGFGRFLCPDNHAGKFSEFQ